MLDSLGLSAGIDIIWKEAKNLFKNTHNRFNWEEAEQAYYQRIKNHYGQFRILGKPNPVSLEGIFTDLYILDKPSAFRRFDLERLKEDDSPLHDAKRQNGLDVVKQIDNYRLFILGKPGAGKTTFLKYIALQAVQHNLHKIPIFVSLKAWSDSDLELMPFLVQEFEICNFPEPQLFIEHILEKGNAIVLFDGLDEVQQENEQQIQLITMLNNFNKRYLETQCIITCRIAATDYSFEKFKYMEVTDFTDEQMTAFVNKWFKEDSTKRDLFLEDFAKDEHKGLRDLGRIPLLLSLLCLAFEETMHFPARRVEIYEEALEALLKKWDMSRNIQRDTIYRKLSLGRKRQLFARIAYQTFEPGDYCLRQDQLAKQVVTYLQQLPPPDQEEDIDGDAVLKAIEAQHSIFVERAHRIYSFSHLTFQEYFTAKYIADNAAQGTINHLINNHLTDERWREVFLMTASLLDNADDFFAVFKKAIDDLIADDKALVKFIKWGTQKILAIEVLDSPSAIRSLYLAFAFVRIRDLNLIRSLKLEAALYHRSPVFELAFARTGHFDLAFARARDIAYAIDHDLVRTCTRIQAIKIDLNLTITWQYAALFSQMPENGLPQLKQQISELKKYFTGDVITLCQQAGLSELHQALINLSMPTEQDGPQAWQVFADKLRQIMQTHRDIGHEWNFTEEQIEKLERYFEANQLLVDCLNLAVVSDREGIENSLLTVEPD